MSGREDLSKQVERFYDGHAVHYESKFQLPLARRIKRVEEEGILDFLLEHLGSSSEGTRLLELGCGTGLFTLPLAKKGFQVTAVDISEGMLVELRAKLAAEAITDVTIVRGDAERFDVGGELFDGVYGIGLLEYSNSPVNLIQRAVSLLRPGGIAVFTAPTVSAFGFSYWAMSLLRKRIRMKIFTKCSFEKLFTDSGLKLLAIRPVGFHLPLMQPLTRIAAGQAV